MVQNLNVNENKNLNINIKQASSPNNISCCNMQDFSSELAPILSGIFTQSIGLGE